MPAFPPGGYFLVDPFASTSRSSFLFFVSPDRTRCNLCFRSAPFHCRCGVLDVLFSTPCREPRPSIFSLPEYHDLYSLLDPIVFFFPRLRPTGRGRVSCRCFLLYPILPQFEPLFCPLFSPPLVSWNGALTPPRPSLRPTQPSFV